MSETKSSWSFVEITPEAREAAERAALAAGMDLDAWLAQLIKYTSSMELKSAEPRPQARPAASPARPPAKPLTTNGANGAAAKPAQSAPQPSVAATFAAAATAPVPSAGAAPAAPAFSLSIAPAKSEAAPRGDAPPPPPFTLPSPAPRPTVSMPQRPSAPPQSLALRPAPVAAGESARSTAAAPPQSQAIPAPPAGSVATGVVPAAAPSAGPNAATSGAPSPAPATQGQAALAVQPPMPARPAILAPTPAAQPPRLDLAAKDKEAPKPAVTGDAPKPEPRPEPVRADAPRMVATDMLHPSRFAALASPKEDDIQAALDKWRASGMLEPLIVRPRHGAAGQFEIISGIDRWHAARRAYVRQIPVLPREAGDQEALELGLVDQLRRAPLSPMAEANIYLRLLNDAGLDTERAARLAGKPAAHVATMVRILNLPKPVRAMLESGEITVMHARALLEAPNPEAIARDIVEKRLDIYQTEQLVRISGRAAETVDPSLLVDEPTDESIIEMGTAPFARDARPGTGASPSARRPQEPGAEMPPAEAEARPVPPPATARRPSEARAPREGDVISTDLLERNIANTLGVRCAISERNGVGVITLHYTSREELVRILTRINGGGAAG